MTRQKTSTSPLVNGESFHATVLIMLGKDARGSWLSFLSANGIDPKKETESMVREAYDQWTIVSRPLQLLVKKQVENGR